MNANSAQRTAVAYTRVSTTEQGQSRHGLDSQYTEIVRWCESNNVKLVDHFVEVASGGLDLTHRTVLASAINVCRETGSMLLVSRLDRFSRSVSFVANSMETFTKQRLKFVSCELGEEVDNFLVHLYASLAEKEKSLIGERTKRGLQAAKAKGKVLGFAGHSDHGKAFFAARCAGRDAIAKAADEFANKLRPIIEPMRKQGMSLEKIANSLNMHQTPTAKGGKWSITSVHRITQRWE